MGTFIVTKNDDGHYFIKLKGKNGKVILNSMRYLSKSVCKNEIETIRAIATDNLKYEYRKTFDGKFYFRLKSVLGEVLGHSKLFDSAELRDSEIEMVRKIAPIATVCGY
jgi:uncharacterized protein YegP (UPF0339 family)